MFVTIRGRLLLLMLVLLGILLVQGGILGYANQAATANTGAIVLASQAQSNHQTADMMHDALRADVLAALLAQNEAEWRTVSADLAEHAEILHEQMRANSTLHLSGEVQQALDNVRAPLEDYVSAAKRMIDLASKDHAAAVSQMPWFMDKFEALEKAMAAVTEKIEAFAKASGEQVEQRAAAAQRNSIIVVLIAVLAALVMTTWIGRRITGSIHTLAAAIGKVRDSHDLQLRVSLDSRDEMQELAEHFNAMLVELRQVLGEVNSSSQTINALVADVRHASDDVAGGAARQAAGLEQITSSLTDLSGFARSTVQSVQQANQLSQESQQVAERGKVEVQQMDTAMSEIQAASVQVAKVNQVIDEIAFQINLLALNAAVEAARAGEAGRGFAVVAEEVRNLAQRSAAAARETSGFIDTSTQKAQRGVEIARRVDAMLRDMLTTNAKVDALIGEIAHAVRAQAETVGQISSGVSSLDRATQESAASAQALASSMHRAEEQVASLHVLMERFDVHGHGATPQGALKPVLPAASSRSPHQAKLKRIA